jgi:hypothetical protein
MTEQEYNVRFTGDYFSMIVCVQGVEGDEDMAVDLAANIIEYQYGWDVRKASTVDIEVEPA